MRHLSDEARARVSLAVAAANRRRGEQNPELRAVTEKLKCTYHGDLYLSWCKNCQLILQAADRVKSGRELLEPAKQRHEDPATP